MKSKGQR